MKNPEDEENKSKQETDEKRSDNKQCKPSENTKPTGKPSMKNPNLEAHPTENQDEEQSEIAEEVSKFGTRGM